MIKFRPHDFGWLWIKSRRTTCGFVSVRLTVPVTSSLHLMLEVLAHCSIAQKLEKANISDNGDAACRPVYDADSSVLRSTMTGICSFYISDSDWCLSLLLYVQARFSYHNILLSISFNALASFSVVLTLSGLLRFAIFLNPASVLPSFIS